MQNLTAAERRRNQEEGLRAPAAECGGLTDARRARRRGFVWGRGRMTAADLPPCPGEVPYPSAAGMVSQNGWGLWHGKSQGAGDTGHRVYVKGARCVSSDFPWPVLSLSLLKP